MPASVRFIRQDIVDAAAVGALQGQWDVAFFGREHLDDRSKFSAPLSRSLARRSAFVQYDPQTFVLTIDGQRFRSDQLQDIPRHFPADRVVFDATTMEFPELALLLSAYRRMQFQPARCVFIYTEPQEYVRRPAGAAPSATSSFDLSSSFRAKNAIPAFTPLLREGSKAHLVAFVGFEGPRLLRVLNDDDGHFFSDVTVVFGTPPYKPMWDMHALMANTRLIEQRAPRVRFSGANNPRGAYLLLREEDMGLAGSQCNRLAVAPFGTKPMAIGAALYCVEVERVRVVYDHPERKEGRSIGVHRTHWFEVA